MNVESVWLQRYGKRYAKGQKGTAANVERTKGTARAEGCRAKSDRNGCKDETAAKAAKDKSAPRLNVTFAQNEHTPKYRLHTKNKVRTEIYYIHTYKYYTNTI